MAKRRIAVLTSGRQDWGILRSTCTALRERADFDLVLLAGGMHHVAQHGNTIDLIRDEGFKPVVLDWIGGGSARKRGSSAVFDTVSREAGAALSSLGDALREQRVEALVLVGDRFETASAALAAAMNRVPLVHLHGGEETEGAIDNLLRHAITKLAHLHLVSHERHRRRVIAMGEDPATVHVVGAPGLDNLHRDDLATRAELEAFLGIALEGPLVVVTLHPTTLAADPAADLAALLGAMRAVDATYVITLPNNDPGHERIRSALVEHAADRERWVTSEALGERRYWGLLSLADAMLGNSSSALIEAPVLGLPVVDIGDRQRGRFREANALHAEATTEAVTAALERALSSDFRATLPRESALGDGRSGERVVEVLRGWTAPDPPSKPAIDIDGGSAPEPQASGRASGPPRLVERTAKAYRLEQCRIHTGQSVRDAMQAMDNAGTEIALAVDGAGCLSGLLTDGDIRRALLAGASLDDPAGPLLRTDFTSVGPGTTRDAVLDLMQARWIDAIPIVDDDRRLLGLHLLHEVLGGGGRPNWAVVLCGGKGERLRPLTETIPKPMLKVAGRPILERIVLHLVGFGIGRIFLAVNYKAEMIEAHFGDGAAFGCAIEYLREEEPLGTGGPIALLPETPEHPLLVLNGDLVTQVDVRAMLERHRGSAHDATIGVRHYQHTVPFGCVELGEGTRVASLVEKPRLGRLINAGIYVLEPALLEALKPEPIHITTLLEGWVDGGKTVGVFEIEDEWIDVGRHDQLRQARRGD